MNTISFFFSLEFISSVLINFPRTIQNKKKNKKKKPCPFCSPNPTWLKNWSIYISRQSTSCEMLDNQKREELSGKEVENGNQVRAPEHT